MWLQMKRFLLITAIWADKNGMVYGSVYCVGRIDTI
jgi:hypothetical protein